MPLQVAAASRILTAVEPCFLVGLWGLASRDFWDLQIWGI